MLAFVASPHVYNMTHPAPAFAVSRCGPRVSFHPTVFPPSIHPRHPSIPAIHPSTVNNATSDTFIQQRHQYPETASIPLRHAIYFTHTAPTACVGPKRLVWALQVSFFSIVFFLF